MSQPKLISPLLDGFVMGDPISDHDGVRCCPAMVLESGKKYIVKIISIPASQTKLDALLLAGAFSDAAAALEYFKELARGVVEEAVLLQRLSRQEGFVSYENWQIVPMEDGTGFNIYLLAPYRPTLDRLLRKNTTTHLEAVNLGLDLCSALAACRRSGFLYTDLRPANVYISADREYRIGDLGFMSLSSLQFASLPDRYHSEYTPPEITDAFSSLNDTMDVYALGMILYQAYNGGLLPDYVAPGELLNAPAYADGQMAQIILKACAPNPSDRWQDPAQMGQALVSYMQTNRVNDTPIISAVEPEPLIPEEPAPAEPEEEQLETEDILAQVDEALSIEDTFGSPMEEPVTEEEAVEEAPAEEETEDAPAEEEAAEEIVGDAPAAEEVIEEIPAEEVTEEVPAEEDVTEEIPAAEETVEDDPTEEDAAEEEAEEAPVEEEPAEEAPVEEEAEEVPVEEEAAEEAPVEEEAAEEIPMTWEDTMVHQELSDILEQVDELIAHELPEPAVAPEPIDVPIPVPPAAEEEEPEAVSTPTIPEEPSAEESQEQLPEEEDLPEESEEALADEEDEEYEEELPVKPKRKFGKLIVLLIVLVLLAAAAFGGHYYYNHFYIQTVTGMQLSGSEDKLTVTLDTKVDNDLLTVYCTDTYGNTLSADVVNNVASFTGLKPNTRYDVYVKISGNHKLTGITTDSHTTSEQTTISGLNAITGNEDGSVILSFTVEGPETSGWNVFYSCPGEEEKSQPFTGHLVTVTGLTPGKDYSFRIEPTVPLYMVGENTIQFTASKLIFAQDLVIESLRGNVLTAVWNIPEGAEVASWTVRCYNTAGYDKTITVESPSASFELLDPTTAYTVEVHAAGMTQGSRAYLSENAVTLTGYQVDDSKLNQITLTWNFEGPTPEEGWLVMYTASGYPDQQVVRTTSNSAVITPVIPGTEYVFTIQLASGSTVFGDGTTYTAPEAPAFQGYWVEASNFQFQMCPTPENPNWGRLDVNETSYTTTFAPGVKASFAITLNHEYDVSYDDILTLVVFRDANGNVVNTMSHTRAWVNMWYQGFGKLDLPSLPTTVGNYSIEVYYNGALVTTQNFTVALPETPETT